VKNTLATVQSIATQTIRTSPAIETFSENFEARLLALSKAHELLTRQAWTGVSLRDIICQELEPYDDGSATRVRPEGADLTLEPRVGLALNLVLHELTTNAAKYGALSTELGLVTVRWSASGSGASEALRIDWSESGGPAVMPPAKRSFGTRLIERSMTKDLQGKATLDFDPAGLRCTLELPLH
jgi:two-component sensor histidine kinase